MSLVDFQRWTTISGLELAHLLPLLLLAGGGIVGLVVEICLPKNQNVKLEHLKRGLAAFWFLMTTIVACGLFIDMEEALPVFAGAIELSRFGHLATMVFGLLGGATVLLSHRFHANPRCQGEYLSLLFFSALGMNTLVVASDFMAWFVALELMSLPIYVLIASKQDQPIFAEGSVKYFLLGSLASAFLLMGVALVYASFGTTLFLEIVHARGSIHPILLASGIVLFFVGVFFKFGLVPFHMYLPDAYQAAPSQITGFIAVGVKVAIFLAAIRVLGLFMNIVPNLVSNMFIPLILLSVVFANVVALRQTNVKRMLAYSSIAHGGYLALGLLALGGAETLVDTEVVKSIVFYLTAYGLATVGVFALLCAFEISSGNDQLTFDHFKGLATRQPYLTVVFLVLMVSLSGLPVSAGFVGKYLVFYHAVASGHVWITVVAILASVFSLYYYFRLPIYAYFMESEQPKSHTKTRSFWHVGLAALCAVLCLLLGLLPQKWLEVISQGVVIH